MARRNAFISEIDTNIGNQIYSARLAKGCSRQELAAKIGVTHQQLQKYEKGTNRISVGRLVLIAQALERSVESFYANLENCAEEKTPTQHQRMCIEVARNFMKIINPSHQTAVNALIKSLIAEEAASATPSAA